MKASLTSLFEADCLIPLIRLSLLSENLEEGEMLKIGFATSLHLLFAYLGYWQATVF